MQAIPHTIRYYPGYKNRTLYDKYITTVEKLSYFMELIYWSVRSSSRRGWGMYYRLIFSL